jgi:hypothetical protein|tara:strand:+ start:122 stop:331 length:210 start_codon:yes stop_codon:yes gene_type:complete
MKKPFQKRNTRHKPLDKENQMYLDNLPNRTKEELKSEFYRLRNVNKPSYWDLMNWMAVYSEMSYRGIKP